MSVYNSLFKPRILEQLVTCTQYLLYEEIIVHLLNTLNSKFIHSFSESMYERID